MVPVAVWMALRRPLGALTASIVVAGVVVGAAPSKSSAASKTDAVCKADAFSDLFGNPDRNCGVSGVLDITDGIYKPPTDLLVVPKCANMMTTNCSLSYAPMKCPEECPYLVPNSAFSCIFECVEAEHCAEANPEKAFPNPKNHICSSCYISGCKHCSSPERCEKCWDRFILSEDHTACNFALDKESHSREIVMVLAVIVGILLITALLWPCIFGTHPEGSKNMVAILRARRHRHLSKVQRWNMAVKESDARSMYSCFVNVHKLNILGVGLPLFYNQICFLMSVALICWAVTWCTYKMNNVHYALANFEGNDLVAAASSSMFTASSEMMVSPEAQSPAMIFSPLAMCPKESSADIKSVLREYAKSNFYAVGALYVILFLFSLWFGRYQKRAAYTFDEQNPTQADYAVHIKGLPTTATDEEQLRAWLQTELRKAIPSYQKRPKEVIYKGAGEADEMRPRPDTQVEVHAVSICYNFSEKTDEVNDVLWNLLEKMDVEMHAAAQDDPWQLDSNNTMAASKNQNMDEVDDDQRRRVTAWFDGKDPLKSTGEAFLVFRWLADKDLVMKFAKQNPDFLKHPEAPTTPVHIATCFSEPPAIMWWHVGVPQSELISRTVKQVLFILAVILVVQLLVAFTFTIPIVWPYAQAGSFAGGTLFSIAGIVLGNLNGFLFMTNYQTAFKLGYHRKDRMDAFVLFTNTVLLFFMTIPNIATTAYMRMQQADTDAGIAGFLEIKTLKAIGAENALARSIFQMLMPGMFIMGLIMCTLMAGVVPWLWNGFLMKVIYVWKCLPTFVLKILKVILPWAPESMVHYPFRSAEKCYDPMEVSISGNYGDHILIPSVCFMMLFFLSPYVWRTFRGMAIWALWEYLYFRWLHLRFCRSCYYSTHRLDAFAYFLWGIPLSIVAGAWATWGIRSNIIVVPTLGLSIFGQTLLALPRFLFCIGSSALSLVLWILSYAFLIDPFNMEDAEESDESKDVLEIEAQTVYSWLNTNPVYVLKCQYWFRDKHNNDIGKRRNGHPLACGSDKNQVRFFEVGKEYLFLKPERQSLVRKDFRDAYEFETYFEDMVAGLSKLTGFLPSAGASKVADTESARPLLKGSDLETASTR